MFNTHYKNTQNKYLSDYCFMLNDDLSALFYAK